MPVRERTTSLALGAARPWLPNHACAAAGRRGRSHIVRGSRAGTAVWSRSFAGRLWTGGGGVHKKTKGMRGLWINAVAVDRFGAGMNWSDGFIADDLIANASDMRAARRAGRAHHRPTTGPAEPRCARSSARRCAVRV